MHNFDTSVPHIARVYDYWLGGKDNFAADRELGERTLQAYPNLVFSVRANRAFLARAVRVVRRVPSVYAKVRVMQRTRCGCWPLTCTDRSRRPKRPALTSRFCITLLELFGELPVVRADPFVGAVIGVPTHIRAEPARRRRAAECLGHRADVVGCAAATDAEVVDSEPSRRRRERAHLVAVG